MAAASSTDPVPAGSPVLPVPATRSWGEVLRPLLIALAALIPLLALNLGDAWHRERRRDWDFRQEEDRARQRLEHLSQNWSFADQFSRLGFDWREEVTALLATGPRPPGQAGNEGAASPSVTAREIGPPAAGRNLAGGGSGGSATEEGIWRNLGERIFRAPFPRHELWVFRCRSGETAPGAGSGAGEAVDLLCGPLHSHNGRQSLARILGFLVRRARRQPRDRARDELAGKLIRQLFGPCLDPEVVAASQRGLPTPVLHRQRPFWLLWDCQEVGPPARRDTDGSRRPAWRPGDGPSSVVPAGTGETVAWAILVPAGPRTDRAALQLALRDLPPWAAAPAGYLRMFSHPVGDVVPAGLPCPPAFRKWRADLRRLRNLRRWEREGLPWAVPVGAWRLYTMSGLHASHLPFLLVRLPPPTGQPLPLFLANLLGVGTLLLLLGRGFLLGRWPEPPLAGRFSALFLLAVSVPILLFLVSATFYLQERRETARHQLDLQLASHLKQLDAGKERLDSDYLASFRALLRDPALPGKILASGAAAGDDLFPYIRSRFQGAIGTLPLAMVAVLDPHGGRRIDISPSRDRGQIEGALRAFVWGVTNSLRDHLRQVDPAFPLGPLPEDPVAQMAQTGYETSTGNSFQTEIEKERSHPFVFSIGRAQASLLHEFVHVDGRPRFAIMVVYHDAEVDGQVLEQGRDRACQAQPGLVLTAFRHDGTALREALPWPDRQPPAWRASFAATARAAYGRGGPVSQEGEGLAVVAAPARRFARTVLVAGADQGEIERAFRAQAWRFAGLLLASLVAALVLGQLTARHVVAPIRGLKEALDRVAAGDLDQRLELVRQDEIGRLAGSFTQMVGGLRERQRLAGMVSAEAMAAIETSGDLAAGLQARSLAGAVLVSDIRDFTTWCEREEPGTVTELLNRHFAAMTGVITAAGGRVHKFIGDAIQAVFPDDEPSPGGGTERAVRAGLGMLRGLAAINRERQARGDSPYRIGIGIAAGDLLAGPIGTAGTRLDFALIGSPFTEAQELEPLSKQVPACPLVVGGTAVPRSGPFAGRFVALPGGDAWVLADGPAALADPLVSGKPPVPEPADRGGPFPAPPERSPLPCGQARGECLGRPDRHDVGRASPLPPPKSAGNPGGAPPPGAFRTEPPPEGPGGPAGRTGRDWRTWVGFLVGAVWLSIPLLGFSAADRVWLDLTHQVRETRARQRHQEIFERFGRANAGLALLEEHLQNLVGRAASATLADGPATLTPEVWRRFGRSITDHLRQVDLAPHLFLCQPWAGLASAPGLIELGLGSGSALGLASGEGSFFQALLHHGAAFYTGEGGDWPGLRQGLTGSLGLQVSPYHFFAERMGGLYPCLRQGRPGWLFWQPVFRQGASDAPGGALVGAVLLVLPRNDRLERDRALHVRLSDDPDAEVALLAAEGGPAVLSEGFPASLALLLERGVSPPATAGWIVTEGPQGTGQAGRFVAASPRTRDRSLGEAHPRRFLVALLAWILLEFAWWRTVMGGGALAGSLRGILLSGMLAAGILPLAVAFPLIERFHLEEVESLRRQTGLALRTHIDDLERRLALHRPVAWTWISRFCRHPRLLRAFQAALRWRAAHPGAAALEGGPGLPKVIQALKAGARAGIHRDTFPASEPFQLEIDLVRVLTARGDALGPGASATGGQDAVDDFAKAMGVIGKGILTSLGVPDDGTRDDGFRAQEVREEIGLGIGLDILRQTFGEDMYLRLIHRPGEPVFMVAGVGGILMLLQPLPDPRRPEFLLCVSYSFHTLELWQIPWVAAWGAPRGFSRPGLPAGMRVRCLIAEEPLIGQWLVPARGGSIPDSRRLARWAVAGKSPLSAAVGGPGGEDLVEVRQGQINRNYVLMAATADTPLRQAAARHRRNLLELYGVTVLLTVLLALAAAGGVTGPVRQLVDGMRRVEAGDYRFRIPVDRDDELGDLVRAFNGLTRALEERELIGRMVSRGARESVRAAGTAVLAGGRCERTLLMIGIPGFAGLVRGMEPSALFAALTRQTDGICGLCLAAGGDIDKVMGDKILVTFAPGKGASPTGQLVEALRGMAAAAEAGRLPFPVVAGAARGTVIAGLLGAGAQYDYTIIGDPVNAAARVASLAEKHGAGTILVTAGLAREMGPVARLLPFGQVRVKGKTQALDLFRVEFPAS
ncbi:MAG: HAMP domain-containing protein [Candidatus Riflebacteria bacterium]|nr:HAMP domain-containing protein [Candidatus Riflebacteria bacterium]